MTSKLTPTPPELPSPSPSPTSPVGERDLENSRQTSRNFRIRKKKSLSPLPSLSYPLNSRARLIKSAEDALSIFSSSSPSFSPSHFLALSIFLSSSIATWTIGQSAMLIWYSSLIWGSEKKKEPISRLRVALDTALKRPSSYGSEMTCGPCIFPFFPLLR